MDIYNGRTFGGFDTKTEYKQAEKMVNTNTNKKMNNLYKTNTNKKETTSVAEEVSLLLNKKFKR